jgi:hypothetical protein
MPRIITDIGTMCAKCGEQMAENIDRCGEPNCECHKYHWVHERTNEGECDLDTETL